MTVRQVLKIPSLTRSRDIPATRDWHTMITIIGNLKLPSQESADDTQYDTETQNGHGRCMDRDSGGGGDDPGSASGWQPGLTVRTVGQSRVTVSGPAAASRHWPLELGKFFTE